MGLTYAGELFRRPEPFLLEIQSEKGPLEGAIQQTTSHSLGAESNVQPMDSKKWELRAYSSRKSNSANNHMRSEENS